ncbi:hypothetical protein SNEBB_003658 [Seison nebaliae]|nr:hypothetical protein SNEBB_003658 [Seison nebaliae]
MVLCLHNLVFVICSDDFGIDQLNIKIEDENIVQLNALSNKSEVILFDFRSISHILKVFDDQIELIFLEKNSIKQKWRLSDRLLYLLLSNKSETCESPNDDEKVVSQIHLAITYRKKIVTISMNEYENLLHKFCSTIKCNSTITDVVNDLIDKVVTEVSEEEKMKRQIVQYQKKNENFDNYQRKIRFNRNRIEELSELFKKLNKEIQKKESSIRKLKMMKEQSKRISYKSFKSINVINKNLDKHEIYMKQMNYTTDLFLAMIHLRRQEMLTAYSLFVIPVQNVGLKDYIANYYKTFGDKRMNRLQSRFLSPVFGPNDRYKLLDGLILTTTVPFYELNNKIQVFDMIKEKVVEEDEYGKYLRKDSLRILTIKNYHINNHLNEMTEEFRSQTTYIVLHFLITISHILRIPLRYEIRKNSNDINLNDSFTLVNTGSIWTSFLWSQNVNQIGVNTTNILSIGKDNLTKNGIDQMAIKYVNDSIVSQQFDYSSQHFCNKWKFLSIKEDGNFDEAAFTFKWKLIESNLGQLLNSFGLKYERIQCDNIYSSVLLNLLQCYRNLICLRRNWNKNEKFIYNRSNEKEARVKGNDSQ